jgi:hypothetical protein
MRRVGSGRKAGVLGLALLLAGIGGGCGTGVTETGYEPNRLGISDAQRKALYAPKYSVESAQAQAEAEQQDSRRRPGGPGLGVGPSN